MPALGAMPGAYSWTFKGFYSQSMFTFQRKENQTIYVNGHLQPHLQGVVSSYLHIYKVWYPYPPTFTRCGNLIQSNITNHLTNVTGSKYKILNPLFQKLT